MSIVRPWLPLAFALPVIASAPSVGATTYYAAPNATGTTCSSCDPCNLANAAAVAMARR